MDERVLEKIKRLSWGDIKKNLAARAPFEAISPLGTMLVRVNEYVPLIALMPYTGHRVREEIASKMSIEDDQRAADEDAGLAAMVQPFPVQIFGLDSRYEYDLDRAKADAIYLKPFQSWGKKVWVNPPAKDEIDLSMQKYDEFHDLVDFFVDEALQWKPGKALVVNLQGATPRPGTKIGAPYQIDVDGAHASALPKCLDAFVAALKAASPTLALNGGNKTAQILSKNLSAKDGVCVLSAGMGRPSAGLPVPEAVRGALFKGAQAAFELL